MDQTLPRDEQIWHIGNGSSNSHVDVKKIDIMTTSSRSIYSQTSNNGQSVLSSWS